MIQAIVCALVPTSGAGMSESGPMMPSSSVAKRRVNASSSFELIAGRVAGYAAFRAAERHIDQRALPGHPHGQRADVIDIRRRMESEAALGRAARDVVLHAIAREDLESIRRRSLHREMDRVLPLRDAQHGTQAGLEGDVIGGGVELRQRGGEAAAPDVWACRGMVCSIEVSSPGRSKPVRCWLSVAPASRPNRTPGRRHMNIA